MKAAISKMIDASQRMMKINGYGKELRGGINDDDGMKRHFELEIFDSIM